MHSLVPVGTYIMWNKYTVTKSCAPEGYTVPVQLVATVVLLFVNNLMISHECEKDRIVITSNGTDPWSFVTQIFRNG
jgi:hypothetical protein